MSRLGFADFSKAIKWDCFDDSAPNTLSSANNNDVTTVSYKTTKFKYLPFEDKTINKELLYEIFSIDGRLIYKKETNSNISNLAELPIPSGAIYIVRVINPKTSELISVSKQSKW